MTELIDSIIVSAVTIKYGYYDNLSYGISKQIFVTENKKVPINEIFQVESIVTIGDTCYGWDFDIPIVSYPNDLHILDDFDDDIIFDILSDYKQREDPNNKIENFNFYSLIGLEIIGHIPDIKLSDYILLHDKIVNIFGNKKFDDATNFRLCNPLNKRSLAYYNHLKQKGCCNAFDEIIDCSETGQFIVGFNYNHGKTV